MPHWHLWWGVCFEEGLKAGAEFFLLLLFGCCFGFLFFCGFSLPCSVFFSWHFPVVLSLLLWIFKVLPHSVFGKNYSFLCGLFLLRSPRGNFQAIILTRHCPRTFLWAPAMHHSSWSEKIQWQEFKSDVSNVLAFEPPQILVASFGRHVILYTNLWDGSETRE